VAEYKRKRLGQLRRHGVNVTFESVNCEGETDMETHKAPRKDFWT
jgi:hypothetical protein